MGHHYWFHHAGGGTGVLPLLTEQVQVMAGVWQQAVGCVRPEALPPCSALGPRGPGCGELVFAGEATDTHAPWVE